LSGFHEEGPTRGLTCLCRTDVSSVRREGVGFPKSLTCSRSSDCMLQICQYNMQRGMYHADEPTPTRSPDLMSNEISSSTRGESVKAWSSYSLRALRRAQRTIRIPRAKLFGLQVTGSRPVRRWLASLRGEWFLVDEEEILYPLGAIKIELSVPSYRCRATHLLASTSNILYILWNMACEDGLLLAKGNTNLTTKRRSREKTNI
jgi:hypothetical protein